MKRLTRSISFLLAWAVITSSVAAQDILEIDNLMGLDNRTNTLKLQPGQAEESRDWDYSVSIGDLVKRRGFSIFTEGFAGISKTGRYTGIKSFVDAGGDLRFFGAFNFDDSTADYYNAPYQWLTKSNLNSGRQEGAVQYKFQYWGSTPQWTTFNQPKRNVLIYANGFNRPLRWNETGMEALVEVAPGSYDYAPMPETASTTQLLDGDYYYAIRPALPCSVGAATTWRFNGLSNPGDSLNMTNPSFRIHVDSDWVQVFGRFDVDTVVGCDPESTLVQIGRTRAGAEVYDSFFNITTFRYANDDVFDYKTFIDTVVDDSLGNANYPFIGFWDTTQYEVSTQAETEPSLTGIQFEYTLGAPTIIELDKCDACGYEGIMQGKSDSSVTGLRYFISFYDSTTKMLSEAGPVSKYTVSLSANGQDDSEIVLMIPQTPSYADHLWKILYRAEDATVIDTFGGPGFDEARLASYKELRWYGGGVYYCEDDEIHQFRNGVMYCLPNTYRSVTDSFFTTVVTGAYYPVDTFKAVAGSVYSDVKRFSAISTSEPHPMSNITLPQMKNPIVYNNRLMFSSGDDIYFSSVTTQGALMGRFEAGNILTIDPSGNDDITALHTNGNVLNVFKNRSWFRVQEIDFENLIISKQEVFPGIGCIAPHSIIDLPGGGVAWLSLNGIHAFSTHLASIFKETTGDLALISQPIQNHLDRYRIRDLQKCNAWLDDNQKNLVFSFPTLDTSYVISLTTGQWTQWTFAPWQTTGNADTSYTDLIEPSNDLIFVQVDVTLDGDTFALSSNDDIYKFGDSAGANIRLDNGDSLEGFWKSGILGKNINMGEFDHFGLWRESNDTGHVTVTLYNEDGTAYASFIVDSLEKRFTSGFTTPSGGQHGFQVELKSEADSLALQGFVLKYIGKGSDLSGN